MNKEIIFKYWKNNKDKFKEIASIVNPEKYGVYLSEGFLLCSIFDLLKSDLIIESGTAHGTSAEIFANYFDIPIMTIDNDHNYGLYESTAEKLKSYSNLTCLKGNSFNIIPELINKNLDKKISVFIDGPKGRGAFKLREIIKEYENIVSIGFHDISSTVYSNINQQNSSSNLYINIYDQWFSRFNETLHSYELSDMLTEYAYLTDKNKQLLKNWGRVDEYDPRGVGLMIEYN